MNIFNLFPPTTSDVVSSDDSGLFCPTNPAHGRLRAFYPAIKGRELYCPHSDHSKPKVGDQRPFFTWEQAEQGAARQLAAHAKMAFKEIKTKRKR